MYTRRDFLGLGLGGVAAAGLNWTQLCSGSRFRPIASGEIGRADADRVLITVQFSGGNDGLNTVIPMESDLYHRARPMIGVRNPIPLGQGFGFNPVMSAFKDVWDDGRLAIIHGCGYPQPNRSHYKALEIWQTANIHGHEPTGWLGRSLDSMIRGANGVPAVSLGREVPLAMVGRSGRIVHRPCAPGGGAIASDAAGFECAMQVIPGMLSEMQGIRVIACDVSGFDTHANQRGQHDALLARVTAAIRSLYRTLEERGWAERVTLLCFSEFGRRVAENSSAGTDHGAAGPMFVLGGRVKGGFYGRHPSLSDLDDGDLKYTTDFRRVYATVLERWLGCDSTAALRYRFEPMGFLSA